MITKLAFNFSGIPKAKGYVTGQLNKARPSVIKSNKEMANSAQQSMKRLDGEAKLINNQFDSAQKANKDVRMENINEYLQGRKERRSPSISPEHRERLKQTTKMHADISRSLSQNRNRTNQLLKNTIEPVNRNKAATQDILNQVNKDIRTGQNIQRGAIAGGVGLGVAGGAAGLAAARKNNDEFQ